MTKTKTVTTCNCFLCYMPWEWFEWHKGKVHLNMSRAKKDILAMSDILHEVQNVHNGPFEYLYVYDTDSGEKVEFDPLYTIEHLKLFEDYFHRKGVLSVYIQFRKMVHDQAQEAWNMKYQDGRRLEGNPYNRRVFMAIMFTMRMLSYEM